MELSPQANITEIRRLILHFNDKNIKLFKQCLLNQAGCENEQDWLHYAIKLISQYMTPQSIDTLRNKAIQLAQTQSVDTRNTKQHCSLYKWVQKQYNDKLSNLPSDIIDHIGIYLDKKQSIEFGYLNKQLYIESQKQSYLNKRWNDKALVLKYPLLDKFLWKNSNPFSYSMPTKLTVESSSINVFSSYWFKKMFSRLNKFRCGKFDCLPYVPIELLFSAKSNNSQNNYQSNQANRIDLGFHLDVLGRLTLNLNEITSFCNRFEKFKNDTESKGREIRNVNELCIDRMSNGIHMANTTAERMCTEILLTFAPVAHKLKLKNCNYMLETENDKIKQMFGNVKELAVIGTFHGVDGIHTYTDDHNGNKLRRHQLQAITRNLKSLFQTKDSSFITFLRVLINLGITQNITRYTVVTSSSWQNLLFVANSTAEEEHLNEIMFNHYDKHLLLKTIGIKLSDSVRLQGMAKIFLYIIGKRQQLLDPLMCRIENIQIDISVEKPFSFYLTSPPTQAQNTNPIKAMDADQHDMFGFVKDCEYDIRQKQINITVSKCDSQEFGIIYQNVIGWLAKIWFPNSTQRIPIKNRIIVIKIDRNGKL